MVMHYTYVLRTARDGHWYTGSTNNLKARMRKHESGQVESTRLRRPLMLVYYEACLGEADARRRERYLKTGRGKYYLRKRMASWMRERGLVGTAQGHLRPHRKA